MADKMSAGENNELFTDINPNECNDIKGGFFAWSQLHYFLSAYSHPQFSSNSNINNSFNQDNDVIQDSAVNNGNIVTGNGNSFFFGIFG